MKVSGGHGPPKPDPAGPKQRRKKRSTDSSDGELTSAGSSTLKASRSKKPKANHDPEQDVSSKKSSKKKQTMRENPDANAALPEAEIEIANKAKKKKNPRNSDGKDMESANLHSDYSVVQAKSMKKKTIGTTVEAAIADEEDVEIG